MNPGAPGSPPAPPPGAPPPAWTPQQPAADPNAADRALAEWAKARGLVLNASPDVAWYQGWMPFVYLGRIAKVGRDLRASFGAAPVAIVEAFEGDPLKQATGDDRSVVVFVSAPQLRFRAAIRSKQGGGLVNDISSGLGSLFGGKGSAGGVLGDPTFEARFDVSTPSRDEGNQALPMPLRQLLLQAQWRGILELRAGGMVATTFDKKVFEPATLDAVMAMLAAVLPALGLSST